jgi:hypothetical protein
MASRPPRRAIRPSSPVGVPDASLRSVVSAPLPPTSTDVVGSQKVTRADNGTSAPTGSDARTSDRGTAGAPTRAGDHPATATRAADDSDLGWGDATTPQDDLILRERPPHWS